MVKPQLSSIFTSTDNSKARFEEPRLAMPKKVDEWMPFLIGRGISVTRCT